MLFRQNLPNLNSKIRVLNAIPSAPSLDIYINGELIGSGVVFSDITCYESIPPGDYEIEVYISGTYDNPLFVKSIDILPDTSSTVNIVTLDGNIDILILNDANILGEVTSCFLRFIHLSPNTPLLSLSLPNDITLFGNVEYLETTGYYPLSSAIYNFKLSFSALSGLEKYINQVRLDNGKFYTIYIIGLLNKEIPIGYLLVEDGEN